MPLLTSQQGLQLVTAKCWTGEVMTDFVGILDAWWREGGTLSFIIPLVLALLFGWGTTSSQEQKRRALFAVLSLLFPLLVPILLPSSRPFATLDWIVVSMAYLGIALTLAFSHVKAVKNSVKQFFNQFNNDNEKQAFSEDWLVAEGASSFKVLIFGIYGLAALLGSITTYLYIGVTRRPEGFIFQNNEGFIAALSLLIIVLAGAAVPIYTELAKQVRTGIDLYESQISSLQQAATNAGHHADFLWTHFERVARSTIREWSSTINEQSVAQANHLMLFMPFLALQDLRARDANMGTIETVRDEMFTPYLDLELTQSRYIGQGDTEVNFRTRMPGADRHYFTAVGTEASLDRVLLFLNTGSDLYESGRTVIEQHLDLLDRRHRTRRLKYLGWTLQGELAIAQARTGDQGVLRCNQDQAGQPIKLELDGLPNIGLINSWEFLNSAMSLVPATEELFVAFLSIQMEYNTASQGQTTPTLIHLAQLEFNRRARRHLHQWSALDNISESASLSQDLATCGDPLDFDVSTLGDDIALFHHLFIATKDGMNQGADARFLYYCFWLIALQNAQTRISQVVGGDRYDGMEPRELLQRLLVDFKQRFTSQYLHEMTIDKEFLLLSLADHKSALYNWLRAAKAVTTRQKLREYESKLDDVNIETQLGIEVIPRLGARLSHLRQSLDVNELQKPLTVRSVYDLLPVDSPSITELRRQRVLHRSVYGEYRRLVDFLQISKSWGLAVAIDNRYTRKVVKIDSRVRWIENEEPIDPKAVAFLNWLGRVFGAEPVPDEIRMFLPAEDAGFYLPLASALWYVSPTYRQEIEEGAAPANSRTGLSENDRTTQLREIHRKVSGYCLNPDNADDMKNTFFGGQDPATRNQAGGQYKAWLERFKQRAIRNE